MSRVILLVGVPGSGKSTLAQKLEKKGFIVLNADMIRQEVWGDAAEQKEPQKIFGILYERLEELLKQGKDVVVDNTNLSFKLRKQITDRARKAGYSDIQLWLLDVPLEVCLERNEKRDRAVPEDVVANMFMELNRAGRPKSSEGKLVILRPNKGGSDFRIFYPE
jgi:predicted kinase